MLVITGASGLLGANLIVQAHNSGRSVAGLCHRHRIKIPGLPIQSVDLTNQAAVRSVLASLRPSQIIHCAAATNVDWCEEHPEEAEAINSAAPAFLSELAEEFGSRFIYLST